MALYGIWVADYSNSYVVDSVYTSLDDAEAVARTVGGDIIEFDVDPPLSDEAKRLIVHGQRMYSVAMDHDGQGAQASPTYSTDLDESFNVSNRRVSSRCWARSEEEAIKILNDRRTQWMAAGKPMPRTTERYGWGPVVIPNISPITVEEIPPENVYFQMDGAGVSKVWVKPSPQTPARTDGK